MIVYALKPNNTKYI